MLRNIVIIALLLLGVSRPGAASQVGHSCAQFASDGTLATATLTSKTLRLHVTRPDAHAYELVTAVLLPGQCKLFFSDDDQLLALNVFRADGSQALELLIADLAAGEWITPTPMAVAFGAMPGGFLNGTHSFYTVVPQAVRSIDFIAIKTTKSGKIQERTDAQAIPAQTQGDFSRLIDPEHNRVWLHDKGQNCALIAVPIKGNYRMGPAVKENAMQQQGCRWVDVFDFPDAETVLMASDVGASVSLWQYDLQSGVARRVDIPNPRNGRYVLLGQVVHSPDGEVVALPLEQLSVGKLGTERRLKNVVVVVDLKSSRVVLTRKTISVEQPAPLAIDHRKNSSELLLYEDGTWNRAKF